MAKRLPFLYVGKNNPGQDHKAYTAQDLADYVYPSQFVIVPGNYENYFNANGTLATGSALNKLYDDITALANLIVNNTNYNFYIGTPMVTQEVTQCNSTSDSKYPAYVSAFKNLPNSTKTFLANIKSRIGATNFNSRCEGIYLNDENAGYCYLNENSMAGHPHYDMFKAVSDYVHNTLDKEFIWAPHYGVDTDIRQIAKLSTTTIFDYIFLQPEWYFKDDNGATDEDYRDYSNHCLRVFESVRDQRVYFYDGTLVVPGKSRAILGVQMEVDTLYYSDTTNKHKNKYQDYYDQFYPYRWKYNFGFYHGHKLDAIKHIEDVSYQSKLVKEIVAPFIS